MSGLERFEIGHALSSFPPLGRTEPCCDEDHGGSHYHCARCNGVSSMLGHTTSLHPPKDGSRASLSEWDRVESHFCCPGDCELGTR